MSEIFYKDRESNEVKKEKIFPKFFLQALCRKGLFSRCFFLLILPLIATIPFFSKLYGEKQKSSKSRKKILPFIKKYNIDMSECTTPIDTFQSFNDFFIRKLKPHSRPIAKEEDIAIIPADGRYLVYSDVSKIDAFYVKNNKFNLYQLVQDQHLFHLYKQGSMVIARLALSDYHRFHFPCDCYPSQSKPINGTLYSVNPIVLKRYPNILTNNKRIHTQLQTQRFKNILFIEVGATFVGSIKQTFTPHILHKKGEEKGYFEFGGSSIILLFQPNSIIFEQDLIDTSAQNLETKAKFGTPMGTAPPLSSS